MYTVYGMADASLAVAFPPVDEEFSCIYVRRDSLNIGNQVIELKANEESDISMELVVEGYSVKHCNIRIVDDNRYEVIPVRSISKTTSGRVQRFKLIDKYRKGEFQEHIHKVAEVMERKKCLKYML